MQLHVLHDWNLTPGAAIALQQKLRDRVVLTDQFAEVRYVAGYVMRCTTKYRLPETTRHAHKLASFLSRPPSSFLLPSGHKKYTPV